MGVASGGVFRTTDGGANWVPITDGKVPLGSTGSIAVADSDPNVIYLGTGSDDVRSNVSTGRGDLQDRPTPARRGSSSGLYNAGQIGGVRIHPTDPEHRLGGGAGRRVQGERRARHLQDDRRRQDVEEGALRLRQRSARWTSSSSPATRTSSTRGCRTSSASRGRSSAASQGRAASTRAPTAASTSRRSRPACRASLIGKANLAVTAANPNRIYALDRGEAGRRPLSIGRRGADVDVD